MLDIRRACRDTFSKFVIAWFFVMSVWWVVLQFLSDPTKKQHLFFGATYGTILTLCAGVVGLRAAHYWGGWKSVMGKGITFLALGMFAQCFGQTVFSVYNIFLGIDVPYPSLADIGYFGVIPLYISGILLFARASGLAVSLRSLSSQIQAVIIPTLMIGFSYYMFLRQYNFSNPKPLSVFLDFGYPIGQGIFVSLAILTYSLSRKMLGGLMRKRVLIILVAFVLQYLSDFNFLYQNIANTWKNGAYGDYLYLLAYVVMAFGLGQLWVTGCELKGKTVGSPTV